MRILTPMLPSNSQSTSLLPPSTPLSSSNSTTTTPQPSPVPQPPPSVPQSVPASSPARRQPLSQGASAEATFTSAQALPSASTPAFPSDSLSARAIMSTLPSARPSFPDSFVLVHSHCQSYMPFPVNTSLTPSFSAPSLLPRTVAAERALISPRLKEAPALPSQ